MAGQLFPKLWVPEMPVTLLKFRTEFNNPLLNARLQNAMISQTVF
jgi:hypothetical protein